MSFFWFYEIKSTVNKHISKSSFYILNIRIVIQSVNKLKTNRCEDVRFFDNWYDDG